MSCTLSILAVMSDHFKVYWFLLLLLVFAQSLFAVVGTNVFQKRHHNFWRLTNDLLARFQLGYISFAVAVFINVSFSPEQKFLSVANALLLVLAIAAAVGGLSLASQDRLDRILKAAGHTCPTSVNEECRARLKLGRKFQIVWGNIFAFTAVTVLALFIIHSIKPGTLSGGEPPQKPQGSPTVKAIPYDGQPEWYGDHAFWLQKEGDRHKDAHLIAIYALGEVKYMASGRTTPFTIILSVPEGYALASHAAFREASAQGHPLLEALDPTPSNDTFRELKVSVSECAKQDNVVVLFRLDGRDAKASINVTDIVRAYLEGGE